MRPLVSFLTLGLLALIVVLGVAVYLVMRFEQPGPHGTDTVVMIERGANIPRTLEKAGVIADASYFRRALQLRGTETALKAGEYRIPARASMADIERILIDGKSILYRVTVPEGWTVAEVIALIEAEAALSGKVETIPSEGSLKPETYSFPRGTARQELVAEMQAAQEATLAAAWEDRQSDLPIATPEEALILASIIEKETGVAEERARVAAVFINRLRRGIRLQSDPTVVYGVTGGRGPLGRGLRRSELDKVTPYNTYRVDGLPPTPIANPGEASIRAALNPADTDDLFFVADGTGGHVFSKTLKEHEANVRKWREIERERASSAGN